MKRKLMSLLVVGSLALNFCIGHVSLAHGSCDTSCERLYMQNEIHRLQLEKEDANRKNEKLTDRVEKLEKKRKEKKSWLKSFCNGVKNVCGAGAILALSSASYIGLATLVRAGYDCIFDKNQNGTSGENSNDTCNSKVMCFFDKLNKENVDLSVADVKNFMTNTLPKMIGNTITIIVDNKKK